MLLALGAWVARGHKAGRRGVPHWRVAFPDPFSSEHVLMKYLGGEGPQRRPCLTGGSRAPLVEDLEDVCGAYVRELRMVRNVTGR